MYIMLYLFLCRDISDKLLDVIVGHIGAYFAYKKSCCCCSVA